MSVIILNENYSLTKLNDAQIKFQFFFFFNDQNQNNNCNIFSEWKLPKQKISLEQKKTQKKKKKFHHLNTRCDGSTFLLAISLSFDISKSKKFVLNNFTRSILIDYYYFIFFLFRLNKFQSTTLFFFLLFNRW